MPEHPKDGWMVRGLISGLIVLVVVAAGALMVRGWIVPPADSGQSEHAAHLHHGQATPFFTDLFKTYIPRQVCMFHEQPVIWLHLISDLLIGTAYFSIPLALISFIRSRRDLAFHWMFWMFAAFILACGTTHLIGAVDLWKPLYKIDGIVKLITAVLSVVTAVALWPLIPKAIALPSAAELERRVDQRTGELAELNQALRREMSARQLAEQDQARLAAIVESSQDAIIGKTLQGIVTSWNRAAQQLFGYTASEMVGQPMLRIFEPGNDTEERDILERIGRGEVVAPYESIRIAGDGRRIEALITVSPIRDRLGSIIGASTIVHDISIQKQHAREREHLLNSERLARAESDRANRLKDEFLATVSHELRTPLTAIMGWSQLLKRNPTPDVLSEGLQTIERNSRAQSKLIEDLLDMSRVMSGKLHLEISQVSLTDVIEEAIRGVEPAAAAKEIRLQRLLDPNVPAIAADPARLQQVVWNLLTNAIKFTPRGGRVQVFLEQADSQIEIAVADSGEGIDPEFLPHLFQKFRQADSTTTRRHGGLGIGLAIVRQLVELHGGSVEAKSDGKGKGATVIARLPIRAVSAVPARGETPPTPEAIPPDMSKLRLEGLSILLVDDETDAGEIVRRILEPTGAKVMVATSAAEGYELVRRNCPGLLLLDIGMPDEDGYSLLRRIRRLSPSEGGDAPAIAVTAFARTEDQQLARVAGFQHHLAKPFEPDALLRSIAEVAGGKNGDEKQNSQSNLS